MSTAEGSNAGCEVEPAFHEAGFGHTAVTYAVPAFLFSVPRPSDPS